MNITYRIPHPTHQYAYLEIEEEFGAGNTPADFRKRYDELTEAFKDDEAGPGLAKVDFDKCLDEYLTTKKITNGADLYAEMNTAQQVVIQAIKRSFARTNK